MSSRLIGRIVHNGLVKKRITSQTTELPSHVPQGREDIIQQEAFPTGRSSYHRQVDALSVDYLVSNQMLTSVPHLIKMQ